MSAADESMTVDLPRAAQAVVYFPGDGMPLVIEDSMTRDDLLGYLPGQISRAVLAARLRTIADMLEPSLLDGMTATSAPLATS